MRSQRTQVLFGVTVFALVAALVPAVVKATDVAGAAEPYRPSVEHGAYLAKTMLCNDCHTPWKLGPRGPEPDMSRALTGHPEDLKLPPPPQLPEGPWVTLASASMTAWSGPWGVSFTANLTPDKETGLGDWSEDMFIKTMRTGLHQGKGRPILPPMPWPWIGQLKDSDLQDLFAYLQSLPPVKNRVPAPIDPTERTRN
jgi:cytochrome c553